MSILASLAKAYERIKDAPPFGYSMEKIGFVIGLNADGSVATVAARGEAKGRIRNVLQLLVPQPGKKSVNISPNFLWGNTSYVLGITAKEDKKLKRLADEHTAFVKYHLDALKHTEDVGLVALRHFLEHWTPEQFAEPPWSDEVKDQNVVFALENERRNNVYLHDRRAAKSLWEKLNSSEGTTKAICLIGGEEAPIARLHPAIKNVWGAQSSGASIVAFNQESFTSYEHEQGDNAPISEAAAFRYTTALNAFLAKGSRNRIQIGDASTVFWADASDAATAERAENTFVAMYEKIDENIETRKVGDILERIRKGQPLEQVAPELSHGVRFHVLGLAPNAARLSIRFWFDNDFGVLARNYQRFVADMRIEPPPRNAHLSLWQYLLEIAALKERKNIPPNLTSEWMHSILIGTPYPLTLLSTVLMRLRADGDANALRVGILKALLVRNFDKNEKEAPVALDPDNKNTGYLLGRLFAVYEFTQTAALGRDLKSTIKDKFYGAASCSPSSVFSLLDRGSSNHLSKIGKERPGQRVNLEKKIAGIMESMNAADNPFPTSLAATDQALFGLGYYHQRSELLSKLESREIEGKQS